VVQDLKTSQAVHGIYNQLLVICDYVELNEIWSYSCN